MNESLTQANLGAGIIICENHKILLVQMNYGKYKGHWILPGGMVEAGEHPEEAAIRELKEETNLEATVDALLAVRHRIYKDNTANVYWVFTGKLKDPNTIHQIQWPIEEITEARFWGVEELLASSWVRPITQEFIKKYSKNSSLYKKIPMPEPQEHNDSAFCP